jgi:copper homeostasis protein
MPAKNSILEICCYNLQSIENAFKAGADRVEFCSGFQFGGTIPAITDIKSAAENFSIPIYVMLRPRGGNFIFSGSEFEHMLKDISEIKKTKATGIVSGFLNNNSGIDKDNTKEILKLISPLDFTFHRAFDETKNPYEALDELISLGVKRVLTS